MRRSVLAAMVLLAVLAWPAAAQIVAPSGERVVLDVELWMSSPEQHGCLILPPGEIAVTSAITRAPAFPDTASVTLRLHSMMGAMSGDAWEWTVNPTPSTTRARVTGGPYCWIVESSYSQFNTGEPYVGLRMTVVPSR